VNSKVEFSQWCLTMFPWSSLLEPHLLTSRSSGSRCDSSNRRGPESLLGRQHQRFAVEDRKTLSFQHWDIPEITRTRLLHEIENEEVIRTHADRCGVIILGNVPDVSPRVLQAHH
jgi:hypothetical protein